MVEKNKLKSLGKYSKKKNQRLLKKKIYSTKSSKITSKSKNKISKKKPKNLTKKFNNKKIKGGMRPKEGLPAEPAPEPLSNLITRLKTTD